MVEGNAAEGAAEGATKGAGKGEVRFTRPDGREIPPVPKVPRVPEQPVQELVRTHQAQGIDPDEWTATPKWHGEAFDYDLAISGLRRRRDPVH